MYAEVLDEEVARVRALLEERLRIRGRDLRHQLARAGRWLPRWARRDGAALVSAQERLRVPKLAVATDLDEARAAQQRLVAHLEAIDGRDRRIGRVLTVLGAVSFNLLAFGVLLLIVLRWRGFL